MLLWNSQQMVLGCRTNVVDNNHAMILKQNFGIGFSASNNIAEYALFAGFPSARVAFARTTHFQLKKVRLYEEFYLFFNTQKPNE